MRKSTRTIFAAMLAAALGACAGGPAEPVIGPSAPDVDGGILTPEVLWSFGRLGEVAVSPDGRRLAYTVTWYSKESNRGNSELFVCDADGGNRLQLTRTAGHEGNPRWLDNNTVAYLASRGGRSWIRTVGADGQGGADVAGYPGSIDGFEPSPDGRRMLLVADVKTGRHVPDIHPDLPQTTGMLYNDLMYRHWDTFEDSAFSHVLVADFDGRRMSNWVDIMPGEPFDAPLKPFGGMEEVAWTPDGGAVAYTCKKLTGKEYAYSTDSDIYLYDLATRQTRNLTQGNPGYDRAPLFSPDGTHMAWVSMERAGFEADKERLMVMDLATGARTDLSAGFDHSASSLAWTPDSRSIYFVSGVEATYQIYRAELAGGRPQAVTRGLHDYHSVALAGDLLVGTKVSITKPAEIYTVDPKTGYETEISFINKDLLAKITMPEVQRRWVKSSDGRMVHNWVILPPNFDPQAKYPALLYCEGGPQSAVSQFWSYRWNFAQMASNGYVVVAPSRRGTLTFGQAWTDQISRDHGGQEMRDLLASIDDVAREPWVDETRMGAVGASYGGYTVFWLAGNHQGRFKTFIAHCGIFHAEMEYLTTEEMFFDQWEMGGAPWEDDNETARRSYAQSPHHFVKSWDAPIMVVHGCRDYRVPYAQGMAAFNAARALGIPARLLLFPDENHWVLSPQNGILWQREFRGWLDQWLK